VQRLNVAEAARALGVSQQAIHGRIKRETIQHETGDDGRIYVFLPDEEVGDRPTANPVVNGVVNDYINALKSQIESLGHQIESLEHDREEWKEEARRKDHIIMALTQRIPELEAAEESRESVVTAGKDEAKGDVRPEAQKPSWWRRIFAS
jgi:hypothetical protein